VTPAAKTQSPSTTTRSFTAALPRKEAADGTTPNASSPDDRRGGPPHRKESAGANREDGMGASRLSSDPIEELYIVHHRHMQHTPAEFVLPRLREDDGTTSS
jgi:hypothetical protein